MTSCTKAEVTLAIGKQSKTFAVSSLKELPYFEAMFSQRWNQDDSKKNDTIQIFDDENNAPFRLNDIELYLKCIQLNCIPIDIPLNLKQIESLVNCSDFFCNSDKTQENKIINKDNLLQYFQRRVPAITLSLRKKWLIACQNTFVHQILMDYNQSLEKQLFMAQQNSLKSSSSSSNGSSSSDEISRNICYDSNTAANLFRSRFSINIKHCKNEVRISITRFNKDLWYHLYNLFNINDYWYYFNKEIESIVEELLSWNDKKKGNQRLSINCSKSEKECIETILNDIMNNLIENKTKNKNKSRNGKINTRHDPNIPSIVCLGSLVICRLNLCHYCHMYATDEEKRFDTIDNVFSKYLLHLNESDFEKMFQIIVELEKRYVKESDDLNECNVCFGEVEDPLQTSCGHTFCSVCIRSWLQAQSYCPRCRQACSLRDLNKPSKSKEKVVQEMVCLFEWHTLLQKLIKGCSSKFIVSKANLWFPIAQEAHKSFERFEGLCDEKESSDNQSANENKSDASKISLRLIRKMYDNMIFDEIIPKFGTQNAFNFGLYLVDFIMYRQNKVDVKQFDQRYFHFLKENLGITWNLTQ